MELTNQIIVAKSAKLLILRASGRSIPRTSDTKNPDAYKRPIAEMIESR